MLECEEARERKLEIGRKQEEKFKRCGMRRMRKNRKRKMMMIMVVILMKRTMKRKMILIRR